MARKVEKLHLLVVVIALTMFGCQAVSASAARIGNPGAFEITGGNTTQVHGVIHNTDIEVSGLTCEHRWKARIDADGDIEIHDVELSQDGGRSSPACGPMDDCGDKGWEGQIEERHGDAPWEYFTTLVPCLGGQGGDLDGQPFVLYCEIDADEIHCGHDFWREEAEIGEYAVGPGLYADLTFEGELFFDHPVEIHHK